MVWGGGSQGVPWEQRTLREVLGGGWGMGAAGCGEKWTWWGAQCSSVQRWENPGSPGHRRSPGTWWTSSGQLSRVVLVLCPQRCCGTHLGVLCTPQPSLGGARSTLSICLSVPSPAYPGAHHRISTLSCRWTWPCASGAAALLPGQSRLPAVPVLAGTCRFPCPQCPLLCCGSSGSLAASPRSAEGAI